MLLVYGIKADKSRVKFDVHFGWMRSAWDDEKCYSVALGSSQVGQGFQRRRRQHCHRPLA